LKHREQKKEILIQDLYKYCKQIGIPETHEPGLCWDHRTFDKILGKKTRWRYVLGRCSYTTNILLIDLEKRGNLKHARHTLVHELVHLRWQRKPHGQAFEDRIQEILKGKTFPIRQSNDEQSYYRKDTPIRRLV
jgi:hypothetical protein